MSINVNVQVGKDYAESFARSSGEITHIVTQQEKETFNLLHVSDLVKNSFGKKPSDCYLHSPTPWDDLYKRYDWDEIRTVLITDGAEVLDITSSPVAIASKTFHNNSSVEAEFEGNLSCDVTETVTNSWTQGYELSIGQEINYSLDFVGIGGSTSMSFTESFQESQEHSKSVTIGTSQGVKVTLQPGQSVKALLILNKGTMTVRMRYKAYLTGGAAVNYSHKYKGHHFYWFNINCLLQDSGLPTEFEYDEIVKIDFYTDAHIEIQDMDTEQVLDKFSLKNKIIPSEE